MLAMDEIERLNEIKEEIKGLVSEVQDMISDEGTIFQRAKSYWIAHILTSLDKDHMYMGGSMVTMEDTINELSEMAGVE